MLSFPSHCGNCTGSSGVINITTAVAVVTSFSSMVVCLLLTMLLDLFLDYGR